MSGNSRVLLKKYVWPQWRRLVLLGLLLLVGIAFQLANPQVAKLFIDGARSGTTLDALAVIALVFLGLVLLTQVAMVVETYVADDLGWRTTNRLRADLVAHVLSLDDSFHSERNAGELVERIDGDVSAVAGFFSRFVVYVLGSAVFLLGIVVVLFLEDWRVGLLLSVFAAGSFVYMAKGGGFVATRMKEARRVTAMWSGYIEERLGGLPDIKANGADVHVTNRLHEHSASRYRGWTRAFVAGSVFYSAIGTSFVLGTAAALGLSSRLASSGLLTVGGIYLVFRYISMLKMPLERLSRLMGSFQRAMGAIVRIEELLQIQPRVVDGPGVDFPSGALSASFDAVDFSYSDVGVLHDVSFGVAPGEKVGLLGRTGSGKTTISRLLFRLYDPESGEVRLGEHNIAGAKLDDLRSRVGLVTQDVQLFGGTLRDNVAMFDRNIDDGRLRWAFEELALTTWLEGLPEGLDTRLGAGGRGLSAGESQLVALARVFLKDPGLVILDEASSRLDPETSKLVEVAVWRLLEGRTGVVIAHRLETVERVDKILVLEAGRVAEFGDREALSADPGSRFSMLVRAGAEEVLV